MSWHTSSAKNTVFNLKSIFFRNKAKIDFVLMYNFVNFQLTLLLRHFAAKCCKFGLVPKPLIIWEFLVCFFNQTFIDVFSLQTNAGNKPCLFPTYLNGLHFCLDILSVPKIQILTRSPAFLEAKQKSIIYIRFWDDIVYGRPLIYKYVKVEKI